MYETETGCVCMSFKPLNAGNNQLTIDGAFSYTKTYSFCGSTTRTHGRFRGSKWRIRNSFPDRAPVSVVVKSRRNRSSRTCHCALWATHDCRVARSRQGFTATSTQNNGHLWTFHGHKIVRYGHILSHKTDLINLAPIISRTVAVHKHVQFCLIIIFSQLCSSFEK